MEGQEGHTETAFQATAVDEAGEVIRKLFERFLNEFDEDDNIQLPDQLPKYKQQIRAMREHDLSTLYVDFQDMVRFHEVMAEAVEQEYYRFDPFLRKALQSAVRKDDPSNVAEDGPTREFYISFFNLLKAESIRRLNTQKVGKLLSVSGQVTRTSEVRPELLYGSFVCQDCNMVIRNIAQQFRYTEPMMCNNPTCSNRIKWTLNLEESQFVDWQRVRLQENTNDIPSGSMPRTMDVILRNDVVDKARAGDRCLFTGCLIVVPDISQLKMPGVRVQGIKDKSEGQDMRQAEGVGGLKDLGVRDLTYKLAFLACSVQQVDSQLSAVNIREETEDTDATPQFTLEELNEIESMRQRKDLFSALVDSIAPAVYGHRDIKTGILLMLFGGVHKNTHEGISLRGDVNVCIVGDPSCAKSQFLKYVVSFLPRAVYTSGKASSAAGLTATVAKDPEDGDFNIEAGALMLADNGICCIDEFDKMDPKDQVAIHEAMEQQTISIAKAGIHATLNARTSILAAANPIGGRYDRSKTLKANVCMTPAIMSRFDLFFVVLDECDESSDARIARHIVTIHQRREDALRPAFTTTQLQRYIKYARSQKPELTEQAGEVLVEYYRRLRQRDGGSNGKTAYRITVRQLESIIRLSEARARVHCDRFVRPEYIVEAAKLLQKSIIFVEMDDVVLDLDIAPIVKGLDTEVVMEDKDEEEWEGEEVKEEEEEVKEEELEEDVEMGDVLEEEGEEEKEDQDPQQEQQQKKTKKGKKEKKKKKRKVKKEVHISFEQYQTISNLLVLILRKREETDPAFDGVSQQDCMNEYLKQVQIDTEEELEREVRMIKCIIQRLVTKDHVLILLEDNDDETKRKLAVHPNYAMN